MSSDKQVIGGITFPAFVRDTRICELKATREDGTPHESKRICIRVRRKRQVVELYAMRDRSFVYRLFTLSLPEVGLGTIRNVWETIKFTVGLNSAICKAMAALEGEGGHLKAVNSPHGWHLTDEDMNDTAE